MVYCLNPHCPQPENAPEHRFCVTCGSLLTLGDRYQACQPLGETPGRHTLLAVDEQQRRCVLKQIRLPHPDALQQVVTAFRNLGHHPQIPALLAAFATEPRIVNFRPTLVQEWFSGTPLTEQLWDAASIRELLLEALPLLAWVHDQGVLHRDLNPQNLRWDACGKLILVDFSLAKVTHKAHLAQTGTVVGSAAYTAPEQLRGQTSPASDLYSLGVMAIHLLTGMHPFDLLGAMGGLSSWVDYLAVPIDATLTAVLNGLSAEVPRDRFPDAATAYARLTGGQDVPGLTAVETLVQVDDPTLSLATWHCLETVAAHRGPINAIAAHPQTSVVATAGADRLIRLWQDGDTQPSATLHGHRGPVTALAFDPTSQTWVSSSWDYTLRRWQAGEQVQRYEGHTGWVNTLALLPERSLLVSAGADRTVRLWDTATGKAQCQLSGPGSAVQCFAVYVSPPDSTQAQSAFLAGGSEDHQIYLWPLPPALTQGMQLSDRAAQRSLQGHTDGVQALCFSPSGQLLWSGDRTGQLRLWQWPTGRCLQTILAHTAAINALALTPMGDLLISASSDQTVKLWQPATGHQITTLAGHTAAVLDVTYLPQLAQIVSVAQDGQMKRWAFGPPEG